MLSFSNDSEKLYLKELAAFKKRPMGDGEPPLEKIYIQEKGYIMPYNHWGNFRLDSKTFLVKNAETFIRNIFFAKEYAKNIPHYTENRNLYPILYVSGNYGVGKTTFLKNMASEMAKDCLEGKEKHFPLYFEMKSAYKISAIKQYFEEKHDISLVESKQYFLIFDSISEGGVFTDKYYQSIVSEFKKILMEAFPASKIVVSIPPIGGPGSVFALDIKSKNGKFMHLPGFTSDQVDKYITKYRKFYDNIPQKLKYSSIAEEILSRKNTKNPLLLNILLRLFKNMEINMGELKKPMLKAELYMKFINSLSPELEKKAKKKKKVSEKISLYRNGIRKLSAIWQTEKMDKRKEELSIKSILGCFDSCDIIYDLAEDKNYSVISYSDKSKDSIEFKHKSFQEYLLAEYILEVFLLSIHNNEKKYKLRVGYISNETIKFLTELILLLKKKLESENGEDKLFEQFIISLQFCDKGIKEWLNKEKTNFKDKAKVVGALLENARNWLKDETVYTALERKAERFLNSSIYSKKRLPSHEHIFCERWYCLIFLQTFENSIGNIPLGNMLKESLSSYYFNNYLLCFLWGTNLEGSDLKGGYLREANLTGTNLIGADLSGAYLIEANLSGADLSGARMYNTNFREANLSNANLSGTNLRESNMTRADMKEINLGRAKLYNTDLSEANLQKAYMRGANLFRADLRDTDLSSVDMEGAYLNETNMRGANLFQANLKETIMSGADLRDTYLRGADLSGADLSGADLNEAYLKGACLDGTHLRGTILEGKI